MHFVGTSYAAGSLACKTVEPIAEECGVGALVCEHPHRLPYFEALQCLTDATALIVPGSSDPRYTASKIYPYLLAKKPLLAVFHEQSSVVGVLRSTGGGVVVTFGDDADPTRVADEVGSQWMGAEGRNVARLDRAAFVPFMAEAMTGKIAECFNRVLEERCPA
jgi:hypothetical protein